MVLRGSNLEMKLGLVFDQTYTQIISPNQQNVGLIQKRGNIHCQMGSHVVLLWFFGKLCSLRLGCHNNVPFTWIYTHQTHVQLTIPTIDVYDMLRLSVVQTFISNGNHLHKWINKKTCLGYVALKLQRWQMPSSGSWTRSIENKLRAHSHIWVNPK